MQPWLCPGCTYLNDLEPRNCEMCGGSNPDAPSTSSANAKSSDNAAQPLASNSSTWHCSACTFLNDSALSHCELCDSANPVAAGRNQKLQVEGVNSVDVDNFGPCTSLQGSRQPAQESRLVDSYMLDACGCNHGRQPLMRHLGGMADRYGRSLFLTHFCNFHNPPPQSIFYDCPSFCSSQYRCLLLACDFIADQTVAQLCDFVHCFAGWCCSQLAPHCRSCCPCSAAPPAVGRSATAT